MKATRAVIVLIEKDGKYLLTQRSSTKEWGANAWQAPGGKVDDGETFEDAAVREVKEEVGIDIARSSLRLRGLIDYMEGVYDDTDIAVFTCTQWRGEPSIMEPEKCSSMGWFGPGDLPESALEDTRIFVQHSGVNHYLKMKNDKIVEFDHSVAQRKEAKSEG